MNKLVIQDDEGKTTVVPLIREEITIGRKEGNTIRLTERNVSRRHARIMRASSDVTIEDLNSYNGVRVNGSRIQGRCPLSISDRVQIGDYLIELKSDEEAAAVENATQPVEAIDPMATTPMPAQMQAPALAGAAASAAAAVPVAEPAPAAPKVEHARMVALSTHYAGHEFELNKPAMVIGRTDENDIVINHRSISRHHAKIVLENGRYAIVDLRSSNGVRVNGEEYGKVELRRGDLVDLGHVRMRFVAAGEDFLFGRDAQAIDLTPRSNRGLIFGILAVLVVGAVAAMFLLRGGSSKEHASQPGLVSDAGVRVAPPDARVVAVSPPDAMKVAKKADAGDSVVDASELAAKIAAAQKAIQGEKWALAHRLGGEALAIDPTHEEAKRLRTQAKQELENQQNYQALLKAARVANYRGVIDKFNAITNDSLYREKARVAHNNSKNKYVNSVRIRARRLAYGKKCDELKRLQVRAGRLWNEAGRAARVDCTASTTSPPDPTGDKTAAEYVKEAQTAINRSQYGRALRLCEMALTKSRSNPRATMICAIAACQLKSASKAIRYLRRLSGTRRAGVRQMCQRNGVNVP